MGDASEPKSATECANQSLARARTGSDSALGALLADARDYLLFVAHQNLDVQLRPKVSPSDVVQETFVQAKQKFSGFVGNSEAEWRGWLRRILINNILAARRMYQEAACRDVAREVSLEDSQAGRQLVANLTGKGQTPSRYALLQEQTREVELVLAGLPSDYQLVLKLRYWEKLSLVEIASQMGRTPDAVQKLWFRAIEQFRREFVSDGRS